MPPLKEYEGVLNQRILEVKQAISELKNNWDGYNAIVPSLEVLNNFSNILEDLPNTYIEKIDLDNIYPNPNGTITIEWEKDKNNLVLIEIGKEYSTFYSLFEGSISQVNNRMNLGNNYDLVLALNQIFSNANT